MQHREKNEGKMKAVIYARYSCERQTEQSIEGQLRECYAYAEKHDITIIGEYIDRAISGTSDNREHFQQMIADSDGRIFDAVLVYKIDRFARNRYDSAIYKSRLKKNGVKVLYAKESIPDGPEGIILESLLEGMAEYYSAELSQKVTRGMRENALKCLSTGGMTAMGYKITPEKTFVIDEDAANIVRQIFEMYDDGMTVAQICDKLNSLGKKSPRGVAFSTNSVRQILENEKYVGVYKCMDIRIEDGIPAIIDRDLFDRVQKRIVSRKYAPAHYKAKTEYLLSGKLYCGKCGAGMTGESATGRLGDKHYYYSCTNKKKHKSCDKKSVVKDWLENLVVSETVKNVLQPDRIDYIAKRCAELYAQNCADDTELKIMEKQLSDTNKSIVNIIKAIEAGIISANTNARLAELEQLQSNLEKDIRLHGIKRPKVSESNVKYMLNSFVRETDQPYESYSRDVIECFVSSVHLYDDKLIVEYRIADGNKLLKSELNLLENAETRAEYALCTGSDTDIDGGRDCVKYEPLYYIGVSLFLIVTLNGKK